MTPANAPYKSFGSVEGVLKFESIQDEPALVIQDLLTNKTVKCRFLPHHFTKTVDGLWERVLVYGLIHSTETGEKISIDVEEVEVFLKEGDLPTTEEMIGILTNHDH